MFDMFEEHYMPCSTDKLNTWALSQLEISKWSLDNSFD